MHRGAFGEGKVDSKLACPAAHAEGYEPDAYSHGRGGDETSLGAEGAAGKEGGAGLTGGEEGGAGDVETAYGEAEDVALEQVPGNV